MLKPPYIFSDFFLTIIHREPECNSYLAIVGTNELIYQPPYTYPIERVTIHEKYNGGQLAIADIGLAKTVNAITLSATVQPIDLPRQDPIMQGTAVFAGFGLNTVNLYIIGSFLMIENAKKNLILISNLHFNSL